MLPLDQAIAAVPTHLDKDSKVIVPLYFFFENSISTVANWREFCTIPSSYSRPTQWRSEGILCQVCGHPWPQHPPAPGTPTPSTLPPQTKLVERGTCAALCQTRGGGAWAAEPNGCSYPQGTLCPWQQPPEPPKRCLWAHMPNGSSSTRVLWPPPPSNAFSWATGDQWRRGKWGEQFSATPAIGSKPVSWIRFSLSLTYFPFFPLQPASPHNFCSCRVL